MRDGKAFEYIFRNSHKGLVQIDALLNFQWVQFLIQEFKRFLPLSVLFFCLTVKFLQE